MKYGTTSCLKLSLFLIIAIIQSITMAQDKPVPIGPSAQLFVDDTLIAKKTNVVRHCHSCVKLEKPVLTADMPWERGDQDQRVYIYGTVLRDPSTGHFRMWYNRLNLVLFAESVDGIHWTRPTLGLHDWQGSTANNIVYTGLHSPSILYNAESKDADFRYVMIGSSKGYRFCHSPDGIHWKPCSDTPAFTGGDTCTLAYDATTNEYLAFHKRSHDYRGHPRRLVYLSTSRDLKTWSDPVLAMAPDEIDDAMVVKEGGQYSQFYNMSVFPYGSQFLGMITHFRFTGTSQKRETQQSRHDGPIDVQLVTSRNGRSWTRCEDRSPVIPNGPYPYDAGCILGVANSPVVVNDELWLYYTAITTTHGGGFPEKQISIALAKWRMDGFVSLDTGNEEGLVETALISCKGNHLTINADIKGTMSVAVLGESGEPLSEFSHGDCNVLSGDSIRHTVTWKKHDRLPSDTPIHLQFRMKNAKLYSFSFKND